MNAAHVGRTAARASRRRPGDPAGGRGATRARPRPRRGARRRAGRTPSSSARPHPASGRPSRPRRALTRSGHTHWASSPSGTRVEPRETFLEHSNGELRARRPAAYLHPARTTGHSVRLARPRGRGRDAAAHRGGETPSVVRAWGDAAVTRASGDGGASARVGSGDAAMPRVPPRSAAATLSRDAATRSARRALARRSASPRSRSPRGRRLQRRGRADSMSSPGALNVGALYVRTATEVIGASQPRPRGVRTVVTLTNSGAGRSRSDARLPAAGRRTPARVAVRRGRLRLPGNAAVHERGRVRRVGRRRDGRPGHRTRSSPRRTSPLRAAVTAGRWFLRAELRIDARRARRSHCPPASPL